MRILRFLGVKNWNPISLFVVMGILAGLCYSAMIVIVQAGIGHRLTWQIMSLAFCGCALSYIGGRYIGTRIMIGLSEDAIARARVELCELILETPIERLQTFGTSKLLALVTADMDVISVGFRALIRALLSSVIVISSLVYLFTIYWLYGLVLVLFLIGGVLIQSSAGNWPLKSAVKARQALDVLHESLAALIRGTRELQLNRQRATFYLETAISDYATKTGRLVTTCMGRFAAVIGLGEFIFFLGMLVLLLPVLSIHAPAKAAGLAVMVMLFVSPSIGEVLYTLPEIGRANVSLAHVSEILGILRHTPKVKQNELAIKTPFRSVELREINHYYAAREKESFSTGPLNFTLKAGEIVFIVGGNGSGKTTFAMLLLGLYEPRSGSILLNGEKVDWHSMDRYRSHYSVVFSDYELFNTLFDQSLEKSQEAANLLQKLRLHGKVSVLDGKFSSTALSSGQRKRLALVLAYLEDRSIYVFDEWAADQDPDFRRLFYSELLPEFKKKGKAVVAITHDDRYFHYADRVLHMQNGQLSDWVSAQG